MPLHLLREDVDQLALALVAPLRAEHHRKLGLAARWVQLRVARTGIRERGERDEVASGDGRTFALPVALEVRLRPLKAGRRQSSSFLMMQSRTNPAPTLIR